MEDITKISYTAEKMDGIKEKIEEYKDIIKKHDSIPRVLDYAAKALEPHEELL